MTVPAPTPARAFIGCAGWTIPRAAAGAFDAEGSHLERYARVFTGVEINSSFYRPHQAKTYARWAHSVPADFRFAVKLPRTITHERKLVDVGLPLQQFEDEVGGLENKLGAVLVQLPPKQDFDTAVAAGFFAALRRRFSCMLACEARHPGWFGPTLAGPCSCGPDREARDGAAVASHGVSSLLALEVPQAGRATEDRSQST